MTPSTILVVDDDRNIRELISVNLRSAGYCVIVASDGNEAMEKIRSRTPDLIILDIMMPEIDGWELCKWVRDDPLLGNVKILMLTAKGTERDKLIGREIFKADEYMTKPFEIDLLQQTVSRLLNG
jgi:two-component system, OmpR family, alkaline phosphatase synthesis response regulator PhoP